MNTQTTEPDLVEMVEELLANWRPSEIVKRPEQVRELLRRLVAEMKRRDDLIGHMWVHSGYQNNGYLQMTTEQKVLYGTIIQRERGIDHA